MMCAGICSGKVSSFFNLVSIVTWTSLFMQIQSIMLSGNPSALFPVISPFLTSENLRIDVHDPPAARAVRGTNTQTSITRRFSLCHSPTNQPGRCRPLAQCPAVTNNEEMEFCSNGDVCCPLPSKFLNNAPPDSASVLREPSHVQQSTTPLSLEHASNPASSQNPRFRILTGDMHPNWPENPQSQYPQYPQYPQSQDSRPSPPDSFTPWSSVIQRPVSIPIPPQRPPSFWQQNQNGYPVEQPNYRPQFSQVEYPNPNELPVWPQGQQPRQPLIWNPAPGTNTNNQNPQATSRPNTNTMAERPPAQQQTRPLVWNPPQINNNQMNNANQQPQQRPRPVQDPNVECGVFLPVMGDRRRRQVSDSMIETKAIEDEHETLDMKPIVGGEVTIEGSMPWMVAIYEIEQGESRTFLCGGSIINDLYIVTAAHCFKNSRAASLYRVRLGFNDMNQPATGDTRYRTLRSLKVHPNYQPSQPYSDIALLELDAPLSFNSKLSPVCLPVSQRINADFTGMPATTAGWGSTVEGGASSRLLQQVTMPIVARAECNKAYQSMLSNGLTKDIICAGFPEGGKDACQGDSGGPLLITDDLGQMTILGVVSHGIGCAQPDLPGLYTNVAYYMAWISSNAA